MVSFSRTKIYKKKIPQICSIYSTHFPTVDGKFNLNLILSGDPEYKPYVCSDADTAVIPLDGTEECIILACDGLWDGVTKEQACQTVQENIDSGADLSQVSSILVTQAKDNGSGDNITAIVVYLNPYHRRNTHLNAKEKAETDTVEQAGNSGQSVADGKSNGGVTNTEEESRGDNSGKASNERGSGEEIKDVLNSNNNNCSVEEKENDFHFRSNISVENKSRFTGKNTVYTQGQRKADKSGQSAPVNDIKHFTSVEADGDLEASRARIRREGVHRGLRRSSSEPPSLYQKMKDTKADGIYPLLEIVSRSKKTNHKALPMKHNSMPATLKPKSTTSNKSLSGTHDAGVSNIFKTKDRQLRRTFPRGTRD